MEVWVAEEDDDDDDAVELVMDLRRASFNWVLRSAGEDGAGMRDDGNWGVEYDDEDDDDDVGNDDEVIFFFTVQYPVFFKILIYFVLFYFILTHILHNIGLHCHGDALK